MGPESMLALVASSLLSVSGIPSFAQGGNVFLPSFNRSFQVQVGIVDWSTYFLLDFFYLFAVWCFVTLRGAELQTRKYLELGAVGFMMMFLASGVKTFVQIYVAASSGALYSGLDASTLASMDSIGLVTFFAIVVLAIGGTCFLLTKKYLGESGWSLGSAGPRSIP